MRHRTPAVRAAVPGAILLTLVIAGSTTSLAARAEAEREFERIERGSLVIEGIPEIPERVLERIRLYQNTRSATLGGWLPGGEGILVTTRFGETEQVHHVARPGGARRQVTFFDEPVAAATASPSAEVNGFMFSRDTGGSEFYQLYFQDLSTGRARMVTDGTSRNGGASWAHDGRRFVFYTTKRNGRDWDVHVADVTKPGASRPLIEKEGAWFPLSWSPDDTRVIVIHYISANEVDPHIVDVVSGKLTRINPREEPIAYSALAWAPDGRGVYFASDEKSEFKRLRHYDLASGESVVLTGDIDWDVEDVAVSDDGKHLAFTTNENGLSVLHLKSLPGMKSVTIPQIPVGWIGEMEFSPDGRKLALALNTPTTPGDIFALDVAEGSLERWTESEIGGLDPDSLSMPELIHFETFDTVNGSQRMIPAFYYRPEGTGPHPVVIDIHGGPEGQARATFNAKRHYLVNELGIAVLRPNVRGSDGYGKSYLKLDNGFKREDSVRDIGALLDWIASRPELDAGRVAVAGGSYGGYMVLASMIHHGDRLRAGVESVGISNFVTFLKNTKDYRRDLRRVEYGDERDPEMRAFLEKISPTTNAHKIERPLLIAQGLNDPRVPASESEQMVDVIRQNGGTVWYLLAKDEGHGFKKRGNQDYYEAATSLFLERYLMSEPIAGE